MGLVNPDIKPLSDDEMRDQLKWALKHFASEDRIKSEGAIPFGRNGPFVAIDLPLRQLCELAQKGLDASPPEAEQQGAAAIALLALLAETPPIQRWKEYEERDEQRIPCFIQVETAQAIAEFFPAALSRSEEK
jgi:hypothetical protein